MKKSEITKNIKRKVAHNCFGPKASFLEQIQSTLAEFFHQCLVSSHVVIIVRCPKVMHGQLGTERQNRPGNSKTGQEVTGSYITFLHVGHSLPSYSPLGLAMSCLLGNLIRGVWGLTACQHTHTHTLNQTAV